MACPILACIEDEHISNPMELFEKWFDDAKNHSASHFDSLCLSTLSRGEGVNARYVKLRKFDREGFVIVTDKRGEKAQEIAVNNKGSMVFLFSYQKENILQNRQVRIRGHLINLTSTDIEPIYNAEPHFCKVRSHIVPQGSIVPDWNELRKLCESVSLGEKKKGLPMPDHYIGYKMIPEIMDFYHGPDGSIADRIVYKKDLDTGIWSKDRIGV